LRQLIRQLRMAKTTGTRACRSPSAVGPAIGDQRGVFGLLDCLEADFLPALKNVFIGGRNFPALILSCHELNRNSDTVVRYQPISP
jgi:hypothetical protein